jgi:plastocyanin
MCKQPALLLSALALALGVAACGGSSSSSSSTGSAASGSTGTSSSASTGTGTAASSSTPTSSASSSAAAGGSGGSGGSSTLAVAAAPSGQLAFDKKSLSAKAGTVKIAFTNMAPLGHNMTIQQGTSGSTVGATPTFQGGTKTLTVKLKPGKYTFFCSVPGHRQGGMQGTLTVS